MWEAAVHCEWVVRAAPTAAVPQAVFDSVLWSDGDEAYCEERALRLLLPLARRMVSEYSRSEWAAGTRMGCPLCPESSALFRGWEPLLIHLAKYWKMRAGQHRGFLRAIKQAAEDEFAEEQREQMKAEATKGIKQQELAADLKKAGEEQPMPQQELEVEQAKPRSEVKSQMEQPKSQVELELQNEERPPVEEGIMKLLHLLKEQEKENAGSPKPAAPSLMHRELPLEKLKPIFSEDDKCDYLRRKWCRSLAAADSLPTRPSLVPTVVKFSPPKRNAEEQPNKEVSSSTELLIDKYESEQATLLRKARRAKVERALLEGELRWRATGKLAGCYSML